MADGIHEIMMRYLLGDELADSVGINPYSIHAPLVIKALKSTMKSLDRVSDESTFVYKSMEILRWVNLNTAVFAMSQGKKMDFNLSNSIQKDLGMTQ
mmetsp:Transcript_10903/g.14990  ORF Transcript_10903/g.14990 Transcript_10903/m.14990 type:complete len:97 (+) Transcript_10903:120-410(+)